MNKKLNSLLAVICFGATNALGQAGQVLFASSSPISLASGAAPSEIVAGDFDQDGRQDFAVAQRGLNSVAVYRQAVAGGFTLPSATYAVGPGPNALARLDFENTGAPNDLVVLSNDGNFRVLSNNVAAPGTFMVGPALGWYDPDPGSNPRLAVGYLDADRRPELFIGLNNTLLGPGVTSVSYRGGSPTAWQGYAVLRIGASASVLLADLDGDARVDGIVTQPTQDRLKVLRNYTSASPMPFRNAFGDIFDVPTLGLRPVDAVSGDFNFDSRPDLVTANEGDNTVSLILNQGNFQFGSPVLLSQAAAPRRVLLADLNNDRLLDLITINADNTINFYQNTGQNGPSRYGAPLTLPTGADPVSMRVADFDGDAQPDVAVACAGDNTVRIYRNNSRVTATRDPRLALLAAYPNPATQVLNLRLPAGLDAVEAALLDVAGRVVKKVHFARTTAATLSVGEFPRGVYLLRMRTSVGEVNKRIVLE